MQFIQTTDPSAGERAFANLITEKLAKDLRVLWFISGGSNIQSTVKIWDWVKDIVNDKLTVMLVDERYGPVGHRDSNAAQLKAAGFEAGNNVFIPVLKGSSIDETVSDYAKALSKHIFEADSIIAQLGIGTDSHIAGILPFSPAITSEETVIHYEGSGFNRITLTMKSLLRIHTAIVFAWGSTKKQALTDLHNQDIPIPTAPAQILKKLPSVFIYNDQVGERL